MRVTTASSILTIALVGCSSPTLFQPFRVDTQDEAGSVHVAVIAVAPFGEYVEALQPDFQLDEQAALDLVVPSTRGLEEAVLDALRITGGATSGFDPTSVARTTTRTSADESGTSVEEITEEQRPAVSPEATQPDTVITKYGDRVPAAPSPSVLDTQMAQVDRIDPVLKYNAATSLLQEVRLLNRYVRDAAVRQDFDPYVVRLQITLMPSARNEPYDAYSTISFFTKAAETPSAPSLVELRGAAARGTPQIIPLLATDNLEATTHSRTVDNIRQMAGAAAFMSGAVTGSAGVERLTQDLQGVLGRDTNSLLTVARLSDNTLRVRLGAVQQAATNFAMIPRNHYVTLLVMVPHGAPRTIEVRARTTMVDAETGRPLRNRTAEEIAAAVRGIAAQYGRPEADDAVLLELLALAQSNDQRSYFERVSKSLPEVSRRAASLWIDLVSLMVGGQFAVTDFDLPRRARQFDPGATDVGRVALFDDGVESCWLTLPPDAFSPFLDPAPVLRVAVTPNETVPLRADRVGRSTTGDLVVVFPSVAAWGLDRDVKFSGIELIVSRADGVSATVQVSHVVRTLASQSPDGG